MDFDLQSYAATRRILVERALESHLDDARETPDRLREAMRYSLLGGGKRLRPLLALAACEAVGGNTEDAIDAACALEFIHTYSLIHDDLPSMDDDDFRRGRAANHKVYGEAMAILAGDALLTEAFRVAATGRQHRPLVIVEVLAELASAAGAGGMVGGQVLDIAATGHPISLAQLELLHRKKTGALLLAAVRVGARLGGADEDQLARLSIYGGALGLAFQIVDDVLDITADLKTLGKNPGSDREAGKTTFVDLLGVGPARQKARQLIDEGIEALASLGESALPLASLARFTVERDH